MRRESDCCIKTNCIWIFVLIYFIVSASTALISKFILFQVKTFVTIAIIFYILGSIGLLILFIQYIYQKIMHYRSPDDFDIERDSN